MVLREEGGGGGKERKKGFYSHEIRISEGAVTHCVLNRGLRNRYQKPKLRDGFQAGGDVLLLFGGGYEGVMCTRGEGEKVRMSTLEDKNKCSEQPPGTNAPA